MRNRPITHERILETAIALFQQNGYHTTGIRELSEAVGLGLGTLYHHIGSKEELLFEISLSLLNDARREAEEAIAGSDDPEATLAGSRMSAGYASRSQARCVVGSASRGKGA